MNIYLFAVLVLAGFAVFDLVVGVSNDAVNFLNPSFGARVASRRVILLFACAGILAGVTFSSGMMEVARKGIFHPQYFTMPDLITLFLAVMIADIVLLDTFSSKGMPTSTTVSVVFELLGAAVAVSLLKIHQDGKSVALLGEYINTSKAFVIIGGIFFAVIVAFVAGAFFQFASRLVFTFDYSRTIRRYGAVWGGFALASITYFILIKGAKGASFMTPEALAWIKGHTATILLGITAVSAGVLQVAILMGVNIFKPIVLIGTFAIAMAFAANDLVNFIGVPMAGWNAYNEALKSADPATASMAALAGKVPASTALLMAAGLVMVFTLWFSRKARTVIQTGVGLSEQDEGIENFGASFLSRMIVRGTINAFSVVKAATPAPLRNAIARRMDTTAYQVEASGGQRPSFDLLRAAVNIMVASILISYGTAHKLPLSTTYVTFMVAMGASFADRAWGRESAVYRVTGVLAVIGGWLLTALVAFMLAGAFATAIFYGKGLAVAALLALVCLVLVKNHFQHARRMEREEKGRIFNLQKVEDINQAVDVTFRHIAILLQGVAESIDRSVEALFHGNVYVLKDEKEQAAEVRKWSNIVIANTFKSLRLLQKRGDARELNYLQVVRRLQKISNGYAEIATAAFEHVANNHKLLLPEQVADLADLKGRFMELMEDVQRHIATGSSPDLATVRRKKDELKAFVGEMERRQLGRIQDGDSKTRLSILFFTLVGNLYMLVSQVFQLLAILDDSFDGVAGVPDDEAE